jgi:predicted lipoprotein with Yx(FWY)xxD motif
VLWRRRTLILSVSVAAVASAAVAVSATTAQANASAKASQQPSSSVEVGTAKIGGLGTVLVRGTGHALYMFAPDDGSQLACSAACQKVWPPLIAPKSGVAKAIDGAKQSLVGSIKDPIDGKRVVTYDGWPLYTYVLDKTPHEATGQNVALNGGYWWVMTPAGKIIRTPVTHGVGDVGS